MTIKAIHWKIIGFVLVMTFISCCLALIVWGPFFDSRFGYLLGAIGGLGLFLFLFPPAGRREAPRSPDANERTEEG